MNTYLWNFPESGQISPKKFRPLIAECHADSGKSNFIKNLLGNASQTSYVGTYRDRQIYILILNNVNIVTILVKKPIVNELLV